MGGDLPKSSGENLAEKQTSQEAAAGVKKLGRGCLIEEELLLWPPEPHRCEGLQKAVKQTEELQTKNASPGWFACSQQNMWNMHTDAWKECWAGGGPGGKSIKTTDSMFFYVNDGM